MIKKITKKIPSTISSEEVTSTEEIVSTCDISTLDLSFGNEDLNKLVEKINEIITKKCQ